VATCGHKGLLWINNSLILMEEKILKKTQEKQEAFLSKIQNISLFSEGGGDKE
jgi:hypothetical protein